jgi:hypothetical protein
LAPDAGCLTRSIAAAGTDILVSHVTVSHMSWRVMSVTATLSPPAPSPERVAKGVDRAKNARESVNWRFVPVADNQPPNNPGPTHSLAEHHFVRIASLIVGSQWRRR